jgi:hypothetical protein
MLMLGLVVLGPKRLQAMLGQVVRAKAELDHKQWPTLCLYKLTVLVWYLR